MKWCIWNTSHLPNPYKATSTHRHQKCVAWLSPHVIRQSLLYTDRDYRVIGTPDEGREPLFGVGLPGVASACQLCLCVCELHEGISDCNVWLALWLVNSSLALLVLTGQLLLCLRPLSGKFMYFYISKRQKKSFSNILILLLQGGMQYLPVFFSERMYTVVSIFPCSLFANLARTIQ